MNNYIKNIVGFILGILITTSIIMIINDEEKTTPNQATYLSQPIASEKILITSAGQSTDTYIIKDVANDLLLENVFKPSAESDDLDGVNSLVIVVAHSDIGEVLHNIDHEKEYERVKDLIDEAQINDLPIIGVYIGGKMRSNKKTDQLIELVFSSSSYNLVAGQSNDIITEDVPLIYVDDIQEIKGPFSSLFR
ncbi:hypothetical protein EZV73_21615 [Acidaminobacter sp. JC074]|uniref:DUF6305 family protein n=1 Tax=Acidaminobacter sp. JC074 TaxID=2530199 RepID=UPI001F0FC3C8|nr:DUF6305 family protein [Acidaminobacter sp. JC074]MCH4890194.1 hypothetical protein [Acidaminobacter sp. JC074]